MPIARIFAALVLPLLLLLISCTHTPTIKQPNPLLGEWKLESSGGRQRPEDRMPCWIFKEHRVSIQNLKTKVVFSNNRYVIDLNTIPHHIDLDIRDVSSEYRRGIFEIEGNVLKMDFTVGGGERPLQLNSDCMYFRRVDSTNSADASK